MFNFFVLCFEKKSEHEGFGGVKWMFYIIFEKLQKIKICFIRNVNNSYWLLNQFIFQSFSANIVTLLIQGQKCTIEDHKFTSGQSFHSVIYERVGLLSVTSVLWCLSVKWRWKFSRKCLQKSNFNKHKITKGFDLT